MHNRFLVAFVAALTTVALFGCTTPQRGPVESAAANVGRAVDDSVITARVKAALVADPTTKAYQINVETFRGEVQLSGFVDSREARRRAAQIASNVAGVRDVTNALEVRE